MNVSSPSGGEGLGRAVRAVAEQPPPGAGAGRAAGVGGGAAVLLAAHSKFRRRGQREGLQGEKHWPNLFLKYFNLSLGRCVAFYCKLPCDILSELK